MLSIKHFVCCVMDVHKKFVVATIALTDYRGVTSYVKKRFATFNSDLNALKKWLLSFNCTEVFLESGGKYWIPIFNILEDSCHVVVAHHKYVRAIKGQETDECVSTLEETISDLAKPYHKFIELATTIPGITEATFIIVEIGVDMAVFKSSKRLCSWAGSRE